MIVEFHDFEEPDALFMSQRIRPMDEFEFRVMSGDLEPYECLMHLHARSIRARAAYVDGALVAIYGVIPITRLSTTGTPWLCATDSIDDPAVRREFIKHTGPELQWIADGFERLWNLVSAENHIAIRWLKWMGFIFDETPYDVRGHTFLRFSAGE